MTNYVFIHLPKTAGFAFWTACRTLFGETLVTRHIDDTAIGAAEASQMQSCRIVAGHISIVDVDRYFSDRPMLTILREPIDRTLSQYFFLTTIANPATPSAQLARSVDVDGYFALSEETLCQTVWNRCVRQLGGHSLDPAVDLDEALEQAKKTLLRCSWVGFHEHLDGDLSMLRRRHPDFSGLELPRVRVTPERPTARDISPALKSRISDLNQYDLKLYAWAQQTFRHG